MNVSGRYHALDAVRAFALLAGIFLHATLSFLPGMREGKWPISDDSSSVQLATVFYVVHIFRMSLFYAIAGFFAHVLLERYGAYGLVRNRLRRIALPFVVGLVVVMPLLYPSFIWAQKQLGMTGWPTIKMPIPEPQLPPWGHLWFLYLLLVLYALWMVMRAGAVSLDRQGRFMALLDRIFAAVVSSRVAPVFFAVPTAVVLYYTPWWQMWTGIPAPVMGFIPNTPAVLAFGSAFAFGWFLNRQPALLDALERDWLPNLGIALGVSIVAIAVIGAIPKFYDYELPRIERIAYAIAYNFATWFWMFGLIGAAMRFLPNPSARWRYLADASFYMYIVHLPIVYTLQAWMIRWPLHWSVKYALIITITMGLLLVSYHYLVRSTFVGQFLNGRKYPRTAMPAISTPGISPG
jgi:peptidoglycan/LPS O-acetylase OafA/YrhL